MSRFFHFACFIFIFSLSSAAAAIQQRLVINRGNFVTVKQTSFPYFAYNEDSLFNSLNKVISLSTSDTVIITVVNNDTVQHGFAIKNFPLTPLSVNAGDSADVTFFSPEERIFIYYDPLNFPGNCYLGLGGMICVNNSSHKKFFWNIKEHQAFFNEQLSGGNPVNWNSYEPDYFTINGLSFPDLQNDSAAVVNANFGDTVLIFVANTGNSLHSLHFHGFHCKVLFSTSPGILKNSEKDTFPLKRMEGAVLQMVPDKTGKYSVHDHNLVAVSGGGTHPNGMFLIMEIQ